MCVLAYICMTMQLRSVTFGKLNSCEITGSWLQTCRIGRLLLIRSRKRCIAASLCNESNTTTSWLSHYVMWNFKSLQHQKRATVMNKAGNRTRRKQSLGEYTDLLSHLDHLQKIGILQRLVKIMGKYSRGCWTLRDKSQQSRNTAWVTDCLACKAALIKTSAKAKFDSRSFCRQVFANMTVRLK